VRWFHKSRKTNSELLFDIVTYGLAIFLILLIVYPLWFVVIASFSNPSDVANGKVWFIPREWKLDGYLRLIQQPLFLRSYLNTILYTVVGTLVALVVNIPAGYALSRKELVGRKWMSILYIIPMFVSGGLIPTYLTVKNVGLIDTFWVMVIPFAVSSYNIIVARTFFNNSIPDGMWEAAQNALIYLTNENLQPLQLILRRLLISNQMLQSQATGEVASDLRIKADMMKYAAIVISTAPIMLLYPFVQKYFNQGVMIGALKE